MHKIWQGSDPQVLLAGLGFFLGSLAMVIHIFAFSVLGYPKTTKAKYNPPAVASALR
ncbi:light-harvesting protein [Pseudogemmatithrix spongiicola]|uniref:Light-harvesting protein n=1 Tax=Pseudogemmatithrix spongiicola TaxID=3062599 RepID=A0AA49Q6N6_9BACT|nr:light-harvesting protein [Gemmatimonadaceae bacterium 'strain 138']WKW13859.1 light-harvesting protein [Gemmatimonadaceae bacterium 'strain 318']